MSKILFDRRTSSLSILTSCSSSSDNTQPPRFWQCHILRCSESDHFSARTYTDFPKKMFGVVFESWWTSTGIFAGNSLLKGVFPESVWAQYLGSLAFFFMSTLLRSSCIQVCLPRIFWKLRDRLRISQQIEVPCIRAICITTWIVYFLVEQYPLRMR